MKLSLTQENLNKALNVVGRIVGSRATLAVLGNVLLSTDKNRLRLSSTNLEMGVNYWVGAKVTKEGAITVPARLLSEYVANLAGGNIELNVEKQTLDLKTNQINSHINGIEASEFPTIPTFKKAPLFKINASELKAAISQVVMASSRDETRPVLGGVYMHTQGENLVLVATDSYRLAEALLATTSKVELKIIIPTRTVMELQRMLDEEAETVEVIVEENQVLFRFGNTELISRLIDGEFPDYRQLIPQKALASVVFDKDEFTNISKIAALFARESAGSVSLAVNQKKQTLTLSSTAAQVGDSTASMKVRAKGEDAEVALNSRYILEGLAAFSSQEVSLDITGKINPCIFRPKGQDNYLHLIMPLRS